MPKKFIVLPSGIIINIERLSLIGRLNAIKEFRARKPKAWELTLQFINEDKPTTFSYGKEDEARADYNALCQACEQINSEQK